MEDYLTELNMKLSFLLKFILCLIIYIIGEKYPFFLFSFIPKRHNVQKNYVGAFSAIYI